MLDCPLNSVVLMKRHFARVLGAVLLSVLVVFGRPSEAFPQGQPSVDRRLAEVRDLNKVYTFSGYRTREEWLERADYLRSQVLASAGLLPMPPRSPLNARVFGRIERDGYTVEKAYFESYPGFSGNRKPLPSSKPNRSVSRDRQPAWPLDPRAA